MELGGICIVVGVMYVIIVHVIMIMVMVLFYC